MSLIKCPECGAMISDKAPQCIHCGFPIKNVANNNKLYSVTITDIIGKGDEIRQHRVLIGLVLEERYGLECQHTLFSNSIADDLSELPKTVLEGVPKQYIECVKADLEDCFCLVEINEYDGELLDIDYSPAVTRSRHIEARSRCPACSSNRIVTGERGFSLLTGFIGSGKTVNRCANCGHVWKP